MTFDEETRDSPAAREAQAGLPARRAAVELLSAVIDKKQPLDDILSRSLATGWMFDLPARDRALARAIVATSLRRRGEIDHVLGHFLERGLPDKSGKLYPILLSGAAQLIFLKTPPHAAIDLAVRLAQWDGLRAALRQARQRRAAARRQGGRCHRGEPRCAARQHAGLAVAAVGRALRRGAGASDRRRQSDRAAARPHGEERP